MSEYPTQRLPIQHGNEGGHGGLFNEPEGRYSRAPRRRRRWPLILVIVVVVLAGLFVVADRVDTTPLPPALQPGEQPSVAGDRMIESPLLLEGGRWRTIQQNLPQRKEN